jgi:vacuolar-type H+-ATPase subunit F/Vma7
MDATGQERTLVLALREEDALGFRLAGVRVEAVGAGHEAEALRALRRDPSVGVLGVEEEILRAAGEDAAAGRDGGVPLLVPLALPRRWGEAGQGRELVAALVRRAVGYHVKLGEGRP